MSIESLKFINDKLEEININYEFMQWTKDIVYPYFVGEYQEAESLNEDGLQETTFILNGFSKGSWLNLEQEKEKIEKLFSNATVILPSGNAIATVPLSPRVAVALLALTKLIYEPGNILFCVMNTPPPNAI